MEAERTCRLADDLLAEALVALERLRGEARMRVEPALSSIAEARHALREARSGEDASWSESR
jgi:hypothetical protein